MLKSNFHKKLHLITFADPKMPFTVHEGLSKNYLMTVSVIFFPFALRNVSFLPPPPTVLRNESYIIMSLPRPEI